MWNYTSSSAGEFQRPEQWFECSVAPSLSCQSGRLFARKITAIIVGDVSGVNRTKHSTKLGCAAGEAKPICAAIRDFSFNIGNIWWYVLKIVRDLLAFHEKTRANFTEMMNGNPFDLTYPSGKASMKSIWKGRTKPVSGRHCIMNQSAVFANPLWCCWGKYTWFPTIIRKPLYELHGCSALWRMKAIVSETLHSVKCKWIRRATSPGIPNRIRQILDIFRGIEEPGQRTNLFVPHAFAQNSARCCELNE